MNVLIVEPKSLHARTRLAAENYLIDACGGLSMTPVILRAGVIYGLGVKLIEAARTLMRWRLMAIWPQPTCIHLLSFADFLHCVQCAIAKEQRHGIYNLCDDQPLFLHEFLHRLANHWGYPKPRRLPKFFFTLTEAACEAIAGLFHVGTPLTRDIIQMGMTSVVADTRRKKGEIAPCLIYPSLTEGLADL